MIGLIDTGGGNRAVFGAGILDYCLDNHIDIDFCIGVSAGAANIVSYIARQRGRNYRFYTDYNLSEKAIGMFNYIRSGSFINLDYIYQEISNTQGKDPFDFESFCLSPQQCLIVATDALSGEPVYFNKDELQDDDYGCISASCNMPIVNRPYIYKGYPYYDGGISDPLPIEKLIEKDCDRFIIILTLPKYHLRSPNGNTKNMRKIKNEAMRQAIIKSPEIYNDKMKKCYQLEEEGKLLFISPDDYITMKPLSKNRKKSLHYTRVVIKKQQKSRRF